MRRQKIDTDINFSNAVAKRKLQAAIGTMTGLYEVPLKPVVPTRSNEANRFYWRCCVQQLMEFLEEQGQRFDRLRCHELIVVKVLGTEPVVNPSTGEVIAEVRRETHTLNKDEFSDFVDGAILWLGETFGIELPDRPGPGSSAKRELADATVAGNAWRQTREARE